MSSNNNNSSLNARDAPPNGAGESLPRGLLGKDGVPMSKSTRLKSCKQARDLTLGGPQRKTFKPNIPVRPRDRPGTSGPVEDKLQFKEKKVKKEKTDRPGAGGKGGRPKGQRNFIQSQSIFEAGPSEKSIKRESIYSGGGGGGGGRSGDSYRVSTSVKDHRPTKAETQEILDQLLRDDFIDDGEVVDMTDQPVTLPLLNTVKYKEMIKSELNIGEESKLDPTDPSLSAHVVNHTEESLKMMLVQLPDSMPGLMAMEGDRAPRTKVKAEPKVHQTMSTEADLSEKLSSKCRLSDLSEGKIGKLQVLSSGKMRLVLGDIMFDVSRGAPCGFLQELVCVDTDGPGDGRMVCLGPVTEKLVVVPNIDNLLNT